MAEVFNATLAALVGAAVPIAFSTIREYLANRRWTDLEGNWYSHSTGNEAEHSDRVEVKRTLTGIAIRNLDIPSGYQYEGTARVLEGRYVLGSWKSTRRCATGGGPFMFTISPQGDYMYGFYGGYADNDVYTLRAWCLGQTEDALEAAKLQLHKATILQKADQPAVEPEVP